MGTVSCVALFLVFRIEIALPVWLVILYYLPMPALLDWVSQTWGIRESTTPLRLLTGSILGVGVGFQVVAGVRVEWLAFAGGIAVAITYAVAIFLLLKVRPATEGYMVDLIQETTLIFNGRRSP